MKKIIKNALIAGATLLGIAGLVRSVEIADRYLQAHNSGNDGPSLEEVIGNPDSHISRINETDPIFGRVFMDEIQTIKQLPNNSDYDWIILIGHDITSSNKEAVAQYSRTSGYHFDDHKPNLPKKGIIVINSEYFSRDFEGKPKKPDKRTVKRVAKTILHEMEHEYGPSKGILVVHNGKIKTLSDVYGSQHYSHCMVSDGRIPLAHYDNLQLLNGKLVEDFTGLLGIPIRFSPLTLYKMGIFERAELPPVKLFVTDTVSDSAMSSPYVVVREGLICNSYIRQSVANGKPVDPNSYAVVDIAQQLLDGNNLLGDFSPLEELFRKYGVNVNLTNPSAGLTQAQLGSYMKWYKELFGEELDPTLAKKSDWTQEQLIWHAQNYLERLIDAEKTSKGNGVVEVTNREGDLIDLEDILYDATRPMIITPEPLAPNKNYRVGIAIVRNYPPDADTSDVDTSFWSGKTIKAIADELERIFSSATYGRGNITIEPIIKQKAEAYQQTPTSNGFTHGYLNGNSFVPLWVPLNIAYQKHWGNVANAVNTNNN